MITQEQLQEVSEFFDTHELDSPRTVDQIKERIQKNIDWVSKYSFAVSQWLTME